MATGDELTDALDAFYEKSIRPEFERTLPPTSQPRLRPAKLAGVLQKA